MRQDNDQFEQRGATIIALGPDGPRSFEKYWTENDIPFIGLADIRSRVAGLYEQQVSLFKLGRMPALFVIDREGAIRFEHYSDTMADIPTNETVLNILDQII